jgi:hypothetical protein
LHLRQHLGGGLQFAPLGARHASLNGRNGFYVVQPANHPLVALRVLYDDFRLAVDRQHFRRVRFRQPTDVRPVVAQKVGQGVDFAGVPSMGVSNQVVIRI